MHVKANILPAFEAHFRAQAALLVRAPGRVNLIGEHTDYNDGFVLPMAIDRAVWIALRPRRDRRVVVHSLDFEETVEFSLDDLHKGKGWIEYLKGVAWGMRDAGYELCGWEGVIAGDVPIGAGLSSSAAAEMAAARAFAAASGLAWDAVRIAKIGQMAENRWVGVNCGVMDQMISAAAEAGHALFLDCRSLAFEHVPLPAEVAVVVMDTSTRRGLVGSAYNERRAQCEAAARYFGVKALRDVGVQAFAARAKLETKNVKGGELDRIAWKRARHVVTENERVLRAVEALRAGDVRTLGRLFDESHASLRDDFEVANDALNRIVAAARAHPACYGARMTGAGFGGCAVALAAAGAAQAFVASVAAAYHQKTGLEAALYVCTASAGASVSTFGIPLRRKR